MAAVVGVGAEDAEHEGGRERPHRPVPRRRLAEAERRRVDGVGLLAERAVGELEKTGWSDRGRAAEGDVGAGEAGVDELLADAADSKANSDEKEEEE
uniref:Uncharacterized protein n=1 Tax=Triticum urartu TaxID=4572 RepID=A0A8R7PDM5_TRIUA